MNREKNFYPESQENPLNKNVIILFGKPGSGKNFIGEIFEKEFGYHFYDATADLTPEMRENIKFGRLHSLDQRDEFAKNLIVRLTELKKNYEKIVFAQALVMERHRVMLHEAHPDAQLLLIESDDEILDSRASNRQGHILTGHYANQLGKIFEPTNLPHWKIINNSEGLDGVRAQLQVFLHQENTF